MFEYLMPLLVMRDYPGTLLDETYGRSSSGRCSTATQRGVPWGISESAYNAAGPRRQLSVPRVRRARPRAEARARRRSGRRAVRHACSRRRSRRWTWSAISSGCAREGLAGRYGYYEAIDYTPERLPDGRDGGVVLPTYMAHHQGMSLVALDNAAERRRRCSSRFHADPRDPGGRSAAAGAHPAAGAAEEPADRDRRARRRPAARRDAAVGPPLRRRRTR